MLCVELGRRAYCSRTVSFNNNIYIVYKVGTVVRIFHFIFIRLPDPLAPPPLNSLRVPGTSVDRFRTSLHFTSGRVAALGEAKSHGFVGSR